MRGCPTLVEWGYCPVHRKQRTNDYHRGNSSDRGYDYDWQRLRLRYLTANPLCANLFALHSAPVSATTVHHIQDVRKRPDLRLVWSNLESLCRDCHERTKICRN